MLRGRYEILERLGQGGAGTVYTARDTLADGAEVALKVVFAGDGGASESLRRELQILAALHHPGLAAVYDFGRLPAGARLGPERSARPGWFLARELCPGRDLAAAAHAGKGDLGLVCRLCQKAAEALEALHRAGIRHGDFKPQNAICDDAGQVRLIDFGLAAAEGSGRAAGTPAFLAPELLRGQTADRRADLYALGITLFALATGEHPAGNLAGGDLLAWHLGKTRPRLAALRRDAPAALDELTARLFAQSPEDRPPSAAEVAVALSRIAGELGAPGPSPEKGAPIFVPPVPRPQARRLEAEVAARLGGAGGPAAICLRGEPGAGKTTILTELSWRLAALGIEVLRGQGGARGRPFAAIAPALTQLAELVQKPLPDLSRVRGPAGGAIARYLAEAAASFPIALVIDDVDRADPSSLAVIEFVARGLPADARVAIVTAASAKLAEPLAEIVAGPLPADAIETMVARTCGRPDPELAAWLFAETGGNALYAATLLETQAAHGFAKKARRHVEAPARLRSVAATRLAQLSADERDCIAALAVVARPVPAAVVAEILASSEDKVAADLERAARAGLVLRRPGNRHAPSTRAVADSALAALDEKQRRAFFSRADKALVAGGFVTRAAEACAYAIAAGHREAAFALAPAAIAALTAAGDHAAAVLLGADLLSLGGGDKAEAGLRLAVGEAARRSADLNAATLALAPLLEAPTPAAERDRARVILGRTRDEAGDAAGAEALFREVIAGESADHAAVAARELARLCIKRGDARAAIEIATAALGRTPDPDAQADLRCIAAFARGHIEDASAAIAELSAIAAAAQVSGALSRLELAQNYAAILAFRRGDYAGARTRYAAALEAAEAAGDVVRVGTLHLNIGAVDFHRGDYAACRDQLSHAARLLGAARAHAAAATAEKNLGHLLLELGHLEQARARLEAVEVAAAERGLQAIATGAGALLGVIAWRAKDVEAGRARLEKAQRAYAGFGDRRREADTAMDIAELCLADGDGEGAGRVLAGSEAIASAPDELSRRARFLALSAEVAAHAKDVTRARAHLAELAINAAEIEAREGRHLLFSLRQSEARARAALGDDTGAQVAWRAAQTLAHAMATGLEGADRIAFFSDPRRRDLAAPSQPEPPRVASSPAPATDSEPTERIYRLLALYGRLSSETDMDRLLAMVMDAAIELFGAERGLLLLADDGGALTTEVARNLPALEQSAEDGVARYSRSVAERVFRTGEPLVSRLAHADPRLESAASVHALGIASVVCVPVCARGKVTGVLYLESRLRPLDLSDGSLRLLSAFGDQVAVVLANARLLSENARRTAELQKARAEIEALLAERTELLSQRTEELLLARRDLAETHRRFLGATGAFGLVGRSPAMEQVFRLIDRLAGVDVPVLITGESGTGKELVARALHAHGPRKDRPLVSVNCAALPEGLLESELFGHVRGAFTGADKARRGLIEAAAGGSLFLDEIGETPPRMQATLLRALQERVIRPVGGERDISVDVRFIAATNRHLEDLVAAGSFRRDLFYRLNVVAVELPPLRERTEDIPLLADHFLAVIAKRTGLPRRELGRDAMAALIRAPWPGNVRQLEHALTTACVLADGHVLGESDLAPVLRSAERRAPGTVASRETRHGAERQRILDALEKTGWNKSRAARQLGIPRRTFYRRLAALDIR